MVYTSDEHMCEHLHQPLGIYGHHYSEKIYMSAGMYLLKGFRLVPPWSITTRCDGVSEHEQRFSISKDYLTHIHLSCAPVEELLVLC